MADCWVSGSCRLHLLVFVYVCLCLFLALCGALVLVSKISSCLLVLHNKIQLRLGKETAYPLKYWREVLACLKDCNLILNLGWVQLDNSLGCQALALF